MQLGGGGIGLWEPGGRVRGYLVTGMDGKPISAICYVQLELELGDFQGVYMIVMVLQEVIGNDDAYDLEPRAQRRDVIHTVWTC